MNTIRIYLAESGRVADLKKDFPLYQGQFQNKLLNIYVPTSILAPKFKTLNQGQTISEYVAGTAVKIGMTYLARNGEIKVSKNYYMRYLKTLTYQNVEYAMFERKLPQEFTLYAGQGSNAPILIINVVNIKTNVDPVEILSIITSQTCSLDVMASSSLDNDDAIEPSELETINARLNAIDQVLPTKQDKTDEGLNTENKTVVGAINELKEDVDINTANIAQNTEDIAQNKSDIDYLKRHLSQPEEYIGQMTGTTLPTNQQLNDFVMEKVGREPKNADVVIFILQIPNATDKNYKYIYSVDGWNGYEIPPMEQASNGTYGIIEGTYNIGSTNNTIVDISGGQILNIYVKDTSGTYRNIREYINANATSLANIINGNTSVGIALRAVADGLGNNIVNTYLTQTTGATKDFVRKYALPREFNDIFYISKDGYSKEIPTDVAPQFSVETNNIGDFTLFDVIKTNDCEYELSRKNSADNAIYISASRDCIVTFRLSTQARNVGQDWVDLDVELSNPISMIAGQLQRVDFSSIFSYLGEKVLDLKVGDMLRQTLEIVMQEITPTTFNVYSNETYPSIFNINTLSQVVYHTLGKLGEQPVFELTPNGAITASGVSLAGSDIAQLYNNVECQVVINIPITTQGYELFNENMNILGIELGGQNVRLATPYNFENGLATFKNLRQVAHSQNAVNGITYTMKCFIKISTGGDITFFVDEDNLNDYVDLTSDQEISGKKNYKSGKLLVDGEIVSGMSSLTKIDTNVGQETVLYDTTDGLTVSGTGQITYEEKDTNAAGQEFVNIKTKNINTEFNVPILPGANINIDANEDGNAIVVSSTTAQDYQIVTAEPEDKSQGKMIYEKSSGVTLGKAVVDKTAGAGQYYSSPAGLVDKVLGGTAVPSDIETYEYLLFKENEYVGGYINIGDLPELTQYALTHNSIEVIFKVNNGAEQSDILTKNSDGSFGNTSNKFQTMKSQNLVEGAGSDYYTLDLQAGGVAQSFKVAETDTIQITKLKLGDLYINIDKGGSEGPFAIENLKIADGTNYNSLKDLVNDGMQEKLTAGTGITIENDVISATTQETQIDNTTITKTVDSKLQAVGLQDETDSKILTAHDIWLACSIEREV